MLHNEQHFVNMRRNKFDKYNSPTPETIPSLWGELSALASVVPSGEVGGVHRLRTSLLASVPTWQLPSILDKLQEAPI